MVELCVCVCVCVCVCARVQHDLCSKVEEWISNGCSDINGRNMCVCVCVHVCSMTRVAKWKIGPVMNQLQSMDQHCCVCAQLGLCSKVEEMQRHQCDRPCVIYMLAICNLYAGYVQSVCWPHKVCMPASCNLYAGHIKYVYWLRAICLLAT